MIITIWQKPYFLVSWKENPISEKTSLHPLIRLLKVWVSSASESSGTWEGENVLLFFGAKKSLRGGRAEQG